MNLMSRTGNASHMPTYACMIPQALKVGMIIESDHLVLGNQKNVAPGHALVTNAGRAEVAPDAEDMPILFEVGHPCWRLGKPGAALGLLLQEPDTHYNSNNRLIITK